MRLPRGHAIVLSIAVDGQEDRVIGTTRSTSDVPALLKAVAEFWERYAAGTLDSSEPPPPSGSSS